MKKIFLIGAFVAFVSQVAAQKKKVEHISYVSESKDTVHCVESGWDKVFNKVNYSIQMFRCFDYFGVLQVACYKVKGKKRFYYNKVSHVIEKGAADPVFVKDDNKLVVRYLVGLDTFKIAIN